MYSNSASGQSVIDAERFDYPRTGSAASASGTGPADPREGVSDATRRQADSVVFQEGMQQGHAQAQAAFLVELEQVRRSMDTTLEKFKKERQAYFGGVENEVVHLALAIARKILHREAQIDPLLLAGMVRVALEKLESGTKVRMHANPDEIHFWREHFAQSDEPLLTPELIGDTALQRGSCYLETEVGSTHISLESQLKEIEQGFFDLLQHRPPVR
jgi:flagellar assembly protein FliH